MQGQLGSTVAPTGEAPVQEGVPVLGASAGGGSVVLPHPGKEGCVCGLPSGKETMNWDPQGQLGEERGQGGGRLPYCPLPLSPEGISPWGHPVLFLGSSCCSRSPAARPSSSIPLPPPAPPSPYSWTERRHARKFGAFALL